MKMQSDKKSVELDFLSLRRMIWGLLNVLILKKIWFAYFTNFWKIVCFLSLLSSLSLLKVLLPVEFRTKCVVFTEFFRKIVENKFVQFTHIYCGNYRIFLSHKTFLDPFFNFTKYFTGWILWNFLETTNPGISPSRTLFPIKERNPPNLGWRSRRKAKSNNVNLS